MNQTISLTRRCYWLRLFLVLTNKIEKFQNSNKEIVIGKGLWKDASKSVDLNLTLIFFEQFASFCCGSYNIALLAY